MDQFTGTRKVVRVVFSWGCGGGFKSSSGNPGIARKPHAQQATNRAPFGFIPPGFWDITRGYSRVARRAHLGSPAARSAGRPTRGCRPDCTPGSCCCRRPSRSLRRGALAQRPWGRRARGLGGLQRSSRRRRRPCGDPITGTRHRQATSMTTAKIKCCFPGYKGFNRTAAKNGLRDPSSRVKRSDTSVRKHPKPARA